MEEDMITASLSNAVETCAQLEIKLNSFSPPLSPEENTIVLDAITVLTLQKMQLEDLFMEEGLMALNVKIENLISLAQHLISPDDAAAPKKHTTTTTNDDKGGEDSNDDNDDDDEVDDDSDASSWQDIDSRSDTSQFRRLSTSSASSINSDDFVKITSSPQQNRRASTSSNSSLISVSSSSSSIRSSDWENIYPSDEEEEDDDAEDVNGAELDIALADDKKTQTYAKVYREPLVHASHLPFTRVSHIQCMTAMDEEHKKLLELNNITTVADLAQMDDPGHLKYISFRRLKEKNPFLEMLNEKAKLIFEALWSTIIEEGQTDKKLSIKTSHDFRVILEQKLLGQANITISSPLNLKDLLSGCNNPNARMILSNYESEVDVDQTFKEAKTKHKSVFEQEKNDEKLAAQIQQKQKSVSFQLPSQEILPESSVDVLPGIKAADTSFFADHQVLTVRHLSSFDHLNEFDDITSEAGMRRLRLIKEAKSQMSFWNDKTKEIATKRTQQQTSSLRVYAYCDNITLSQISEDKFLKSPYLLFEEYVNMEEDKRIEHPWKSIYYTFLEETFRWLGGSKPDLDSITDIDVYSFLIWRATKSFAKHDHTAGARAIYITFERMPERETAIQIDQILSESSGNPATAGRYTHEIPIDVTKLLQNNRNTKIYQTTGANVDAPDWVEVNIDDISSSINYFGDWNPGESFFHKIHYGCIVTNTGAIPMDCMMLSSL
eukprot:TRINITY_DN5060_c0_g1_i1.p1 TRINITY_DN5060_c0_g1~~TRINITY_DN5060_c0_g1_i1.p1  ORF type:complete len:720 (-),score=212.49 TRINITY_DN5060_c0_g1_i1:34-2193(-)